MTNLLFCFSSANRVVLVLTNTNPSMAYMTQCQPSPSPNPTPLPTSIYFIVLTLNKSITWRLDNLRSQIWHWVAPFSHKAILCLDSRSTLFSVSLVNRTGAPRPNFLVFLRRANGDPLWYITIAINWKELRVTLSSTNNQHQAVYGR